MIAVKDDRSAREGYSLSALRAVRCTRGWRGDSQMSRRRRSYESGHKPKYLVVVDNSPECDRAIYYASRRVSRIGVGMIMLRVIDIEDRNQQWLGVADIMRAEAYEEANAALDRAAGRANGVAGITPERVIREGVWIEQILKLIDEDEDIAILILAAGTATEGPGPAGFGDRPDRRRIPDPGGDRARPSHRRGTGRAVLTPVPADRP